MHDVTPFSILPSCCNYFAIRFQWKPAQQHIMNLSSNSTNTNASQSTTIPESLQKLQDRFAYIV